MSMTFNPNWTVQGFAAENIAVADAAIGVTEATAKLNAPGFEASYGFFTVETAPLRYWYTGNTPTSTSGHLVQVGENFEVHGRENIRQLRMFRTTGTSASVMASYAR